MQHISSNPTTEYPAEHPLVDWRETDREPVPAADTLPARTSPEPVSAEFNGAAARPRKSLGRRLVGFVVEFARVVVPLAILAVGVGGVVVFGQKPEPPKKEEAPVVGQPVKTAPVVAFQGAFMIEVEGTATPWERQPVVAEVAGRIKHREEICRAGRTVKAGTKLLEVDSAEIDLEVLRLQASLEMTQQKKAEMEVEQANTQELLKLAREDWKLSDAEWDRVQALVRKGSVSRSESEGTQRKLLTSQNAEKLLLNQANLQAAKLKTIASEEKLAQAQLDRAKLDAKRTTILAPLDGNITTVAVEENDFVTKGQTLLTITDTSCMEVKTSLQLEELAWIWEQGLKDQTIQNGYELPHAPVTVIYSFQGRRYHWEGKLSRFEGTGIDQQTRTAPVRILVEKPADVRCPESTGSGGNCVGPTALFSGMYVDILIPIQTNRTLLEIPEEALRPGNVVWVSVDNKLELRPVTVARRLQDTVLLDAGSSQLTAGETVVTSPLANARDGLLLRSE